MVRFAAKVKDKAGASTSQGVEVRVLSGPPGGDIIPWDPNTDWMAELNRRIAAGPTAPLVLGVGTYVFAPGVARRVANACLNIGGTKGLTIQGEHPDGTILKLKPENYAAAGTGLDLHIFGGLSNQPIEGFTLRGLTVDGSWREPGMFRTEQMHGFHPYSPYTGVVFEDVRFKRIAGDSAKFMKGQNIRTLRCSHRDNGRSGWSFHTNVVGFESVDDVFERISDQWIDCEPGRACSGFRIIRPRAVDGFITTGEVDDFLIEDGVTGSVMIGRSSSVRLVRPVLSSRQVGMNGVAGAIRQMAAVWSIKDVAELLVEDPQITADAAHAAELIKIGYRVRTPDGVSTIQRAENVRVAGGSIRGGAVGFAAAEAQVVTIDGVAIESGTAVALSSRQSIFDATVPKTAGPWKVANSRLKARGTGIRASLGDTMEGGVLRLGGNQIDAPTPTAIDKRITVENI